MANSIPGRGRLRLPKATATISLVLGLMAAVAIVGFNEVGYRRSSDAVSHVMRDDRARNALHLLMQSMQGADAGQRGYLLTGQPRYLEPYEQAIRSINEQIIQAGTLFADTPEEAAQFNGLAERIVQKLSEMQATVRLRRDGNDDAWKFLVGTDVGDDLMAEIRVEIKAMIENRSAAVEQRRESIVQSLKSARGGIALTSVIALLAFYQTLRQARALAAANQRRKEELESERDQLDGLVKQRTARLAELATYLQRVREDERAHLARELHDELGSLLTAAKLDVARLKSKIAGLSPEVQDRLKHLTESLNAGIALKRRIIEDLRPSSLANLGLAASLDILAREFSTRADLEVTTEIEEVQLDASAQLTAYRLVQESLTNIGKYAHAKKVQVRVRALPAEVLVEVRDDGKGFHPDLVQPDAHGLAGMRHRVESAGGTLEVTSSAGSGTRIAGRLPKSGVMRQSASPDSMQINDTALANRG